MSYSYHASAKRTISTANYQTYVHGILHPDRVMKEHDFVYIVDGFWEIYQNGIAYPVYPDDVILLPAGEHHYGLTPCQPNTKTMYIHASVSEGDGTGQPCAEAPCDSLIPLDTVIHCQKSPHVQSIFHQIVCTFWADAAYKPPKLSALLSLLICELAESLGDNATQSTIVDKITQTIQQNPQQFYSAKELANDYGLSEKTLINHFKNRYGKTLYQYQMDSKIRAVRYFLLSHPEVKLYEAAVNFGFYDEFHLSKVFKKYYGLSPRQYKQQYMSEPYV